MEYGIKNVLAYSSFASVVFDHMIVSITINLSQERAQNHVKHPRSTYTQINSNPYLPTKYAKRSGTADLRCYPFPSITNLQIYYNIVTAIEEIAFSSFISLFNSLSPVSSPS